MDQSNCDALSLHMIAELLAEEKNPQMQPGPRVGEQFISSPWYTDVIFILQHLQAPQGMDKTRAMFLKHKETRLCILNEKLYWKELRGVLLNYVDEHEAKRLIE